VEATYYENEDENIQGRRVLLPPFCKLKLSGYINQQQHEQKLAKTLQKNFGKEAVLVFVIGLPQ
jgi:hypothetical protein